MDLLQAMIDLLRCESIQETDCAVGGFLSPVSQDRLCSVVRFGNAFIDYRSKCSDKNKCSSNTLYLIHVSGA
jgi:hypothetical protein